MQDGVAHPLSRVALNVSRAVARHWEKCPPSAPRAVEAVVISQIADMIDEENALAKIAWGARLRVVGETGETGLVRLPGKDDQSGWIQSRHVRVDP